MLPFSLETQKDNERSVCFHFGRFIFFILTIAFFFSTKFENMKKVGQFLNNEESYTSSETFNVVGMI